MENKHRRAADIVMIAVFVIIIFGFALALIIKSDRDFSEMENRNLAQKPELSWSSIKSGDFSDGLESYISDQLFAKDALVTLKTDFDRLLGKSYQNGVYLIKDSDGRLRYVQKYTEDREQIRENAECLNDLADKLSIPVDMILVPNVSAYTLDKLPAGADCNDQKKSVEYVGSILSDKIGFYPMTETLAASYEQNYYLTDHHWTSWGAALAAEDYLRRSGQLAADGAVNKEPSETVKDFYGTLYSKAPSAFADPDVLEIGSSCGVAEIEWVAEGKSGDNLIERSFLEKKDKYAAFLGGNFAQVRIRTGREGEKVLILKDSYANAAVQYLTEQYSEITMIDLRYYCMQERSVSELCEDYGVDRVIMLYNMDFINEDRNFVWLS